MIVQRVERHTVVNDDKLDSMCHLSKNLYNYCNFILRQLYFSRFDDIMEFKDLIEQFMINDKICHKIDEYVLTGKLAKMNQVDYRALPAATSQQVVKLLYKNWKSYFKSLKVYYKDPAKFTSRPSLPKYKEKDGKNIVVFTGQVCKIKNNFIHFPKLANLNPIKTKVNNICQIRVVPQATCYVVEVVYKKEVSDNTELIDNTYLSIDIGVNNLATCVNNIGERPFIVNGRALKSINQYFNKKKAELQSFLQDKQYTSSRINKLTLKRNCKVNDYMHKVSRFIVDYCVEYKIKTIVIGKNDGWKQEVNMKSKNNQNFVCIPFNKLIDMITYKAEERCIKVIVSNEAYTSKCSFLDNEEVCKHSRYAGKRIKRGLFRSATKQLINADVNGACNIMRKVVPEAIKGIEGLVLNPYRVCPV